MTRSTQFDVDPIFVSRWSPRAFDPVSIPEVDVNRMLEAARWAPSAYNIQPWRFVYALRDDENWDEFVSLLNPFNAGWAKDASVLFFLVSDTIMPGEGDRPDMPAGTNSLDAGGAWVQLALQATQMGYHAHAMAGIEYDQIHEKLQIPERFKIEAAIAVGSRLSDEALSEEQKAAEVPSPRKAVEEIAFRGSYQNA